MSLPTLKSVRQVRGHRLLLEPATLGDAEFILSLRLDPDKNLYLSSTSGDLARQREYIRALPVDGSQIYFIIKTLDGHPVGTVRLYDLRGSSFCWGSWILSGDAPPSSAVESTVMVYAYGLECGFTAAHFDVRKGNEKVWRYHERWGALRVDETELDYLYSIDEPEIRGGIQRYATRVPEGVRIDWSASEP